MNTNWTKLDASFLLDDISFYTSDSSLESILDLTTSDIKKTFAEFLKNISNDEFSYILSTFFPKQRFFIKSRFSLIKKINLSKITDFILYILKKSMYFDILIINDITSINASTHDNDTILIFYKEHDFYKNVGADFNDEIVTIFNKSDLPPYLFNLDLLITEHLKRIINSSDQLTLNDIIHKINNIIKISDTKLLLKLIKNILN